MDCAALVQKAESGAGDGAREGVQMARIIIPAWKRWGRRLAIVPAVAMLATFVLALPSNALDGFESSDGNLTHNTVADWNDFATDGTLAGFKNLTDVEDNTGNPDDIYSGGVKQDQNCPPINPTGSLGGGNGKFDLERIYLTGNKVGTTNFLYLAWERVPSSATASAHVAYEFNHGTTSCGTGSDLVNRVAGDKLIEYDFEGGTSSSTSPSLKLATWLTSGGHCQVASHVAPCWGDATDPDGYVDLNGAGSDAAVNSVTVGTVHDDIQDEDLAPVQFGEAGINLNAAGIDPCDLTGKVTGVSRSSGDAGTAQMKDEVGPAAFTLAACTQATGISSQISLDDHATVSNFDNPNVGAHTGDLIFRLYGPNDTDCDGTPVYTTTIANIASGTHLNPTRPWSTADGDNSASSYIVPSTFAAQGDYDWVVTYEGDGTNLASHSNCGDERATVDYGIVQTP
jgi:hypothetical protein